MPLQQQQQQRRQQHLPGCGLSAWDERQQSGSAACRQPASGRYSCFISTV
jgi:hypothetical protein